MSMSDEEAKKIGAGKVTQKMINTLDAGIDVTERAIPKIKQGARGALDALTVDPEKLGENIRKGTNKISEWFGGKKPPKKEEE